MNSFSAFINRGRSIAPLFLLAACTLARELAAQEHGADHTHEDDGVLHFVHPLVSESVSPDTKVRLDYILRDPGSETELELEAEYAFRRTFSIEAGVHLDPAAAELGDTHLLFKFANYALARRGVLLGYGLSVGLPTGGGHDHAEEHTAVERHEDGDAEGGVYEFEPFVNAGVMLGELELVAWTLVSIPSDRAEADRRL
ncbi:MAG: hypothetical protein KY464_08645, partial [Gemmatimonadetes bacterium]|nr:hypothetical protein [Gemmatimonadota bacterium]